MGRPTKSDPRDRQLNLSLTTTELASIQRRAEALGMRPVHFSRVLLLDERRAPKMPLATDLNASRLLHGQLIRLGNNLNQIVRRLHQTKEPLPADLVPLLAHIRLLITRMAP